MSTLEIGQNQNQKLKLKVTLVSVDILENLLRIFPASLNKLKQKKAKFVWNQNCQIALYTLKEALIMAPVSKLPPTHDQFVLDTDASGLGVGAVLSQLTNGTEHRIVYSSRALSRSQQNYCTTKREL